MKMSSIYWQLFLCTLCLLRISFLSSSSSWCPAYEARGAYQQNCLSVLRETSWWQNRSQEPPSQRQRWATASMWSSWGCTTCNLLSESLCWFQLTFLYSTNSDEWWRGCLIISNSSNFILTTTNKDNFPASEWRNRWCEYQLTACYEWWNQMWSSKALSKYKKWSKAAS